MVATVRRKQSIETSKAIIHGHEPTTSKDTFRHDLIKALNWYNTNWDEKEFRASAEKYVIKHLKMKDTAYALSKADFIEIRMIGVLGRLIMRHQFVDLDHAERLFTRIEHIKTTYIKPKSSSSTTSTATPMTVQERIMESARSLASSVDGAIDDFVKTGEPFSMKSFLLQNQVSGVVSKKIGEFYKPMVAELDQAVAGKDDQLKVGYSNFTKRGLKQFAEFIRQIVADCDQQVVSAKVHRKPRARKEKPASVIVKKMSYLKEYADLNLKSVSAEKIVGSSELWVYNTVSRKLIVYYGADGGYLGVSGMSITNYDVTKSEVKTLRDPAKFFKGLTSTGKRAMANAWKTIRAKVSKPRARINDEMILLAAN